MKSTEEILKERHEKPQMVIDHLLNRYREWKTAALNLEKNSMIKFKQLARMYTASEKIRKEEERMKNWWRGTAVIAIAGASALLLVLLAGSWVTSALIRQTQQPYRVPVSGRFPETPNQVLSSVNILTDGKQGSGTIISKGNKGALLLSAAHTFAIEPGEGFWVYYADGSYTRGKLLAVDRNRDLSISSVDSGTILDYNYIPEKVSPGSLTGVGYTKNQGPNYRTLQYSAAYYGEHNRWMWSFNVTSGPYWDGDSGSGVFMDGGLIAVAIQRDSTSNAVLYAVSHSEIVAFLEENKKILKGCGSWREATPKATMPTDGPPMWKPSGNVPIYVETKTEKDVQRLQTDIQAIQKVLAKRQGPKPQPPQEWNNSDLRRPSEVK